MPLDQVFRCKRCNGPVVYERDIGSLIRWFCLHCSCEYASAKVQKDGRIVLLDPTPGHRGTRKRGCWSDQTRSRVVAKASEAAS